MHSFRITAAALLASLLVQCAPQRAPALEIAEIDSAPHGALVGSPDPALLGLLARSRMGGARLKPASRK